MNEITSIMQINVAKKRYDNELLTLKNIDLQLKQGEFVALVGPSGAGKTTLLNIVAGLDQQFTGHINFAIQNPRIGFMFQDARLMPWLTVRQNIELVCSASPQSIDDWLTLVGLADFMDSYPSQLSGGMQKRVSLVRAFIVQPDVLLMDEPFQSLDAPTGDQLRALLQKLWLDTHATVLFVTHNLEEALTVANRVIFFSPRPAQVVLDYPQPHPYPRKANDRAIKADYETLLKRYPDLLSGYLAGDNTAHK